MSLYVADFEADGLRPHATTVWCGVIKDVSTDEVWKFYNNPEVGDLPLSRLEEVIGNNTLIMHNGIGFDRWLLKTVLNINIKIHKIIDTLKLSQILHPDLKVPEGWKGVAKPHSVEAWGMRFGIPKPVHEDWSKFSPEMLHRCEEDVRIQEQIFIQLMDDVKDLNKK